MDTGTIGKVETVIAGFRPRTVEEQVASFARTAVRAACPPSGARARALLFAASRLGAFATGVGLPLELETCFSVSVIERFILLGCDDVRPATRRSVRTNLRFLARALTCDPSPAPASLPRERAKPPYSPAEIASYLALADTQPTIRRRMRASALICLGTGAGLVGGELRHVRGNDIVARSGGLLVAVSGPRRRAVPVLSPYHGRLIAAAAFFSSELVVCARHPERHNVTTPLISALSGGADLPRLETGRLRATYLVAMAETIGLRAFMDAAGITCSQRLGDLVSFLAPLGEDHAIAVLGGRA